MSAAFAFQDGLTPTLKSRRPSPAPSASVIRLFAFELGEPFRLEPRICGVRNVYLGQHLWVEGRCERCGKVQPT